MKVSHFGGVKGDHLGSSVIEVSEGFLAISGDGWSGAHATPFRAARLLGEAEALSRNRTRTSVWSGVIVDRDLSSSCCF